MVFYKRLYTGLPKPAGFKMLLNVTVTLAKQAWNLQLIKDGIFGTTSSFNLKVIARGAIAMNIILLFRASENNLNSLNPTGLCNTPFLFQNLSNTSLPLLPSYKFDIGTSVTEVKHYSAVFTWTGAARDVTRYNKMLSKGWKMQPYLWCPLRIIWGFRGCCKSRPVNSFWRAV